jgi:broad specificity phosphatase PhoE
MAKPTLYIIRHGETEWSLNGKHTGLTDLDLTPNGVVEAEKMRDRLKGIKFDHVFSSPLQRAHKTCEISGLGKQAIIHKGIVEWDYGEYEGITSKEIHKTHPGWNVFEHGGPGGESVSDITKRIDDSIAEFRALEGNIAIFSHGHFSRAFAARWLGLTVTDGRIFILHTATLNIMGWYRERPVIELWNG